MLSFGFVGIFAAPFDRGQVTACVDSWLERFEKIEQIPPQSPHEVATLSITKTDEILWGKNLQFRVLNGVEFTWVYLTMDRNAIETTGLPAGEISLCLDVLLELPGLVEVVPHTNEHRLDELEEAGLL